jgi:hypothetical protein
MNYSCSSPSTMLWTGSKTLIVGFLGALVFNEIGVLCPEPLGVQG